MEQTAYEPKILGFLCNWCSYPGADLAGVSRFQYPPNLRVIRVMCSARVDPVMIVEAFIKGLDGVMVLGCHFGDCHYVSGNYFTEKRVRMTTKFIQAAGVIPDRLYLDWVSAAEGEKFAKVVTEFTQKIKEIGPLGISEKMNMEDLKENLATIRNALNQHRIRWLAGNHYLLTTSGNVFGEKVPSEVYENLITNMVKDEYIRNRILYLSSKSPVSCKALASKIGASPAIILKHLIYLRRRNLIDVHSFLKNTPLYIANPDAKR